MKKKSIKVLENEFKSKAQLETSSLELKRENSALKKTVTKLLSEIDRLQGVDKEKTIKLNLTPEEEILHMQISRLLAISRNDLLSLEESKMLDMHIKNKRLIEEKSTSNNKFKTVNPDVSDEELQRIAESVEEENN